MRYADCSLEDGLPAARPGAVPCARQRRSGLLPEFVSVIGAAGIVRAAINVLLSLVAALAGSIAAIALVPLVQAGSVPAFERHLPAWAAGGVVLVAIFACSIGVHVLLRWMAARLAARIVGDSALRLRCRVHARLVDADIGAFGGSASAEITNVLTANVDLVTQGIGATSQLLVVVVTTAVNLAFAFWVSPALTLSLPALAGLAMLALHWQGREQSRISHQYVHDMTRLFQCSEEFPRRLRHLRSFQREAAELRDYGAISARLARAYRRQIELTAAGKLIVELFAAAAMVGVFLVAGRWHGFDRAQLVAVGLLLGRLLPYVASTRHNIQQVRLAIPAFELWRRYANLARVRAAGEPATNGAAAAAGACIERVQVQLPSLHLEVRHLALVPGELTLVAGDSGIGKSSLVDVLAGMARPAAFVAHSKQHSLDFDGYRALVRKGAYVCQSFRPWQHTVRACLSWAAPGATETELRQALADVGFGARLRDARGDLDTELQGASCRLSGGELQRLLLAQVILRRPAIAILDEATGALDATSEINVLLALKRRLPQTILVVVSHRQGLRGIADQCLHIGSGGSVTIERVVPCDAGAGFGA